MSLASVYIPLSQGKVAVIDWEDRHLAQFKWHARKSKRRFYAARNLIREDGKKTLVDLHRVLFPNWKQVDHKDGDGLNNRRENLRESSNRQNHRAFQRKPLGVTSLYRGVCKCSQTGKWRATIKVDRRQICLGRFEDERAAARAYNSAAVRLGFEREALNSEV